MPRQQHGAQRAGSARLQLPRSRSRLGDPSDEEALPGRAWRRDSSVARLRFHVCLTQKEPSPRLSPGLAWVTKEAKLSPTAPCRPCSPPATASRATVAHRPATEGQSEERGHLPALQPTSSLPKPAGHPRTHQQRLTRSWPAGGAVPGAGATVGHPTPGTLSQEGWASSSCIILAIIPAARKIYGVRRPLCKIINKGRQYNLLKPPWKLNSSGGENAGSH